MLGSYIILRFILLGAMENPEPRYTVIPILIVAAAATSAGSRPVRVLNSTNAPLLTSNPSSSIPAISANAELAFTPLCDNPLQIVLSMRLFHFFPGTACDRLRSGLGTGPISARATPPPVPLVLVGGTVDLTGWGDSARDIPSAIVVIRAGKITMSACLTKFPFPKTPASSTAPANS